MKKCFIFAVALVCAVFFQGCVSYVYGPGGWSYPGAPIEVIHGGHPGGVIVHGPVGHGPIGHGPVRRMMAVTGDTVATPDSATASSSDAATAAQESTDTDPATLLAMNYGISVESAQAIEDFFAQGSKEDEALQEMGVDKSDMMPLLSLEMPSSDTLANIASHLHEQTDAIDAVFSDFVSQVQAEKAAQQAQQ